MLPEISSARARTSRHPGTRTLMTQFSLNNFLLRDVTLFTSNSVSEMPVPLKWQCGWYVAGMEHPVEWLLGGGKKEQSKKKDNKSKRLHLASHLLNRGEPQFAGLHCPFVLSQHYRVPRQLYLNIQCGSKVVRHSIFNMHVFPSDFCAPLYHVLWARGSSFIKTERD